MEDQNGNKRKRFTDEQLSALTDLAEEANWSLLSVAKEVREHFCLKHEISKVSSERHSICRFGSKPTKSVGVPVATDLERFLTTPGYTTA